MVERRTIHLQVFGVHLLCLFNRRHRQRRRPPEDAAAFRRVGHVMRGVLEFVLPVHVRSVADERVQHTLVLEVNISREGCRRQGGGLCYKNKNFKRRGEVFKRG